MPQTPILEASMHIHMAGKASPLDLSSPSPRSLLVASDRSQIPLPPTTGSEVEAKRGVRGYTTILVCVLVLAIGFLLISCNSQSFSQVPHLVASQLNTLANSGVVSENTNTIIGLQNEDQQMTSSAGTPPPLSNRRKLRFSSGVSYPGVVPDTDANPESEAQSANPPQISDVVAEVPDPDLHSSFLMPRANLTHTPTILLCPRRHDVAYYASLHQRPVAHGQRTFQNHSSPSYARRESIHGEMELSAEALAEAERAEQYIAETSGFDIDSVRAYRYYHLQMADWASMELTKIPIFVNRHNDVPQVYWTVWEVDVDVEKGEALIPFFVQTPRGSGNEGKYWQWDSQHLQFQDEFMETLKSLTYLREPGATPGMLQCRWTFGDDFETEVHEVTYPSLMSIQGQHRHMVCPFQAGVRPRRLQIVFDTTKLPTSSPIFEKMGHFFGELDLPLCMTWQRRVGFSAMLRPVFGRVALKNVMDWVDYNIKIGIDTVYIPDRDGNLFLRDDLDDQSVHAERLRTAIELGRVQYYLWPMRWAPKASYNMLDNEDQQVTMFMLNNRAKYATTWMLSADFDEYLHIPGMEIFDRQCDNSLFCDSPLRRWMFQNGLAGKGQLRFVQQAVVGQKVTQLTVAQHPHLPVDHWRFAPISDKTGLSFAEYAKVDTSRVCPYEPQTDAARKRVARFQELQLTQPSSERFVNSTYCELPFAVKYLYTMPFVNMHQTHCKFLYRVDSMFGTQIHGNAVTRDEHLFEKPQEWAKINVRHFADINGRLEHESEKFVAQNDYSPQSVASYFEGKVRDVGVADIMMGTSLPPPTTKEHVLQKLRLDKLPTKKLKEKRFKS